MAYNYFPATYYQPQPIYQQSQMPMQQTQTTQNIIWVNSEAEAQSYPVAPNNAVALWDSSKATIYLKQTDASGRPTFKAYDLVEHKIAPPSASNTSTDNLISKEDLNALRKDIAALMNSLKIKKTKREVEEDE